MSWRRPNGRFVRSIAVDQYRRCSLSQPGWPQPIHPRIASLTSAGFSRMSQWPVSGMNDRLDRHSTPPQKRHPLGRPNLRHQARKIVHLRSKIRQLLPAMHR